MKRKFGLTVCCALLASSVASGTNVVRVWYASDPNGWSIQADKVRIIAPGTYKIDAITTPGSGLGVIDKIWIDPNGTAVNGDVFVYVVRDPNYTGGNTHQPGCTQLKEVNLLNVTSGYSGNLVEVRMTSHAAANGKFLASNITDNLVIGGNVLHDIEITGDILKPLTITGALKANLSCSSLHDLTVSGVSSSLYSPPDIFIGSSYTHHMTVHQTLDTLSISGAVDPNASIQITGSSDLYNLSMPTLSGVIYGTVSVQGKLRSAHLEGIGEHGSLSVGTQIGNGANDYFDVTGDISGSLTASSVYTDFEVDGAVTGTGSITVSQSFDTTTGNFPAASIGGVDPNGLIQIGTLAGELEFTQPISGEVHISDDLSGRLAAAEGITGSVQIQGDLSGALYAASDPVLAGSPALAGSLNVGGDVTAMGDIYGAGPLSAAVTIGGSLAGTLRTSEDDPNAPLSGPVSIGQDLTGAVTVGGDLSGSLTVGHDLTGTVTVYRDLRDPAAENDPNADLLNGHIIVAGSFKGPSGGGDALIYVHGEKTGPHPFFAVDYDGWTEGADWGTHARVAIMEYRGDFPIYSGNTPAAHVWEISECRGDIDNNDVWNLADSDALVEAIADPQAYAYHYPGLGSLAPDPNGEWTTGSSRGFHCDLDCSDSVDYLDLNAFMVAMTEDPNCFTDCPGSRGVVPNQAADLTAQQLLENVAVERYGNLWDLETQLAQYAPLQLVRLYWTAVRDYHYTLRAFPASLDFPGDPNQRVSTEHKTITVAGLGREFSYDVSVDNGEDPNVAWLTVDKTTGTFAHGLSIEVTVHRSPCATGAHAGYVNVGVVDPNSTSFAFDIPVTMTKPLTNPKIVACLEIGGFYDPNDPNDPNNPGIAHAIAGLRQWRRVTDTAIVYNIPLNDAADIYAMLTSAVPGMTIYPGITGNGTGCVLDDPNHWANPNDPNDPNTVAGKVNRIARAAGESTVFLDNELLGKKYTDDPNHAQEPGNYYECDPNTEFDLSTFAIAMDHFQQALDPNITIVWYPGVSWGTGECDPNNPPWVMSWTEDLIEQACLYVEPRLVSLSYGDHACKNPNYNECLLEARAWEDSNCPAQPMFPIVWIGDPNDQNSGCPPGNYDYGCYWTWNQVNAVLAELRLGDYPRQDAILYPGYTDWELTGQHVADNLWDPNQ
jgi:hypothetical protein